MVTPGDWLALSALLLTGAGMAGGIVYRMGQIVNRVEDLSHRVDRNETRLARMEGKMDRRARLLPVLWLRSVPPT
jgi:hypothetical protein